MKYRVTIQSDKAGTVIDVEATDEGDALQKGMDYIADNELPEGYAATSAQPIEEPESE